MSQTKTAMTTKRFTSKQHPARKHKTLEVWIGATLVGRLTWFEGDDHLFEVDNNYDWDNGDPILSLSMKDFHGNMSRAGIASRTRLPAFFSNLLPEGALRDYLAAQSGVKSQREFALLNALSADLPGAVILRPDDEAAPPFPPTSIVGFEDDETHDEEILRFSLAGIQLKFSAIMEASGGLTIPANGIGGSYIVKLPSTRFPNVPENEYSMMMFAKLLGMEVADVELRATQTVKDLPPDLPENFGQSLIVKRFDRDGHRRIHMEDFAQVYGLYAHEKYTRVSYGGIASVLWKEGGSDQLIEFVRRLTYTLLIGNADMHLKNWTLLYPEPQQPVLSPAYDFVSTITYLPDPKLGLSIAGEKTMLKIDESTFRKMAAKANLPEALVVRTMKETVESFKDLWPRAKSDLPMSPTLIETIENHVSKLQL